MPDETPANIVRCRCCGYTLGTVERCPECADHGHVYLVPDAIPRAWLFALVLSFMVGCRPIFGWPIEVLIEGSVDAWIHTITTSVGAFLRVGFEVSFFFYALWVIFRRRTFVRLAPHVQWCLAMIPAVPIMWRWMQSLLLFL